MWIFILKRIFYIILVTFLVSGIIFGLNMSLPGDPAMMWMEGREGELTPEQFEIARQEIIETMGLDGPLPMRFIRWWGAMLRGDFGQSMQARMPVAEFVRMPMLNTIIINILNLIIVFAITIPVGIYCAIKRGKLFDNGWLVFTMFGLSIPNFLFALILIVVFAVLLPTGLPLFGMHSIPSPEPWTLAFVLDRLRFMILPLAALTLTSLAGLVRFIRSAMIEAISMDYVRTARAKGLAEKTVVFVHAFRNALIPIITAMAGWFIGIFGGSVAIEQMFLWNGMGNVMIVALHQQDLAVVMTLSLFYALIAFIGLLIMDLAYVVADPRIKFD